MNSVTITGPSFTGNNTLIDLTSGYLLADGSEDTLVSSVSGVGIKLQGNNNLISVRGAHDTITAGYPNLGQSSGDSLIENGSYNQIFDYGFRAGGVTLNGSHNTLDSLQKTESSNFVIGGAYNTVVALYLTGNIVISGNNEMVTAGAGSFTVSGANDTVTTANAKSIIVSGSDDVVENEAVPGYPIPVNLQGGDGGGDGSDTVANNIISVTGAGDAVTSLTNNNEVEASGSGDTIAAYSYDNTVSASGDSNSIVTEATNEHINISGENSSVSTSVPFGSVGHLPASVPSATVTFTGNGSVGAVFADGSNLVTSGGGASVLNLSSSNTTVTASVTSLVNDTVGGNFFTIGTVNRINVSLGVDTVSVLDDSQIVADTITGSLVNFGSGDYYIGRDDNALSAGNVLNFTGNDNGGMFYQGDHDTINVAASSSGNLFCLVPNSATWAGQMPANTDPETSLGSAINIAGVNTILVETSNNTIDGTAGALVQINARDNFISGDNITLQLSGGTNIVNVTGSDTITSASPYSYANPADPNTNPANQLTVQGGQVTLGGLDDLVQTAGTARIDLYGGNNVTLNGANDTVNVSDRLYGGNVIHNNGTNNAIFLNSAPGSETTIYAAGSSAVAITEPAGEVPGVRPASGLSEKLDFIAQAGANSIFGADSNVAVTLDGGASSYNVVYGGADGANSLNGGLGGGDLLAAGGNNDVLTAGAGGNNTLVSAAGNETLTGSAAGGDLFSIMGGGGTDLIQGFAGTLELDSGLNVSSETVVNGALNIQLSDGTQLILAGVTSLTQHGNLFSL